MKAYRNIETTSAVKTSTYETLDLVDKTFEVLTPLLVDKGYINAPQQVDTLVITKATNKQGEFATTQNKETLIYVTQVKRHRDCVPFVFAHEYGHLIHYNLELQYGELNVNRRIADINNNLPTTASFFQDACKNTTIKSMYDYWNKSEEVYARMIESVYCNHFGINAGFFQHVLYTPQECEYFFKNLL